MSKTVTLRLDEEIYEEFREAPGPSAAVQDLIETAALFEESASCSSSTMLEWPMSGWLRA